MPTSTSTGPPSLPDGVGELRLAGLGQADDQASFGNLVHKQSVLFRVFGDIDDLLQPDLGLVGTPARRPHPGN